VFLIDAYYRITKNLQAQQNVRKALMLWQAITSLIMCVFFLFSVKKMEIESKLKLLISLIFFSIFNIASLLVQWHDIISQAIVFKSKN
jgi:hypothetical protein